MRLHYDHRLPCLGGGYGGRQTGQPGPDHRYNVPIMFSHAVMTPPAALL
jgi:hypothetical protein